MKVYDKKIKIAIILSLIFAISYHYSGLLFTNSYRRLKYYREEFVFSNPVILPTDADYGLIPLEAKAIQIAGIRQEDLRKIFQQEAVSFILTSTVPAAIAGFFRSGEGKGVDDKTELKAIKDSIDGNAVTVADKCLIELSKRTGIIFVLGGAEGPERDIAPGGKPGTIYYWDGKITDDEVRQTLGRLPKTPEEIIKFLKLKGSKVTGIRGVVVLYQDAIENTNAVVRGNRDGWSIGSMILYTSQDMKSKIIYIPDFYFGGYNYFSPTLIPEIHPYSSSGDVFNLIAQANNIGKENLYGVILDRPRHSPLITNLFYEGIDFSTIPDGDAVPRIATNFGEKYKDKFIIGFGAGGANENFMSLLVAHLAPNGHAVMRFVSKDNSLAKVDVIAWEAGLTTYLEHKGISNITWDDLRHFFSADELERFKGLNYEPADVVKVYRSGELNLPQNIIFSAVAITGGLESTIGEELATQLPPIQIIKEGKSARIIVKTMLAYKGALYILELSFYTSNLEETIKALRQESTP